MSCTTDFYRIPEQRNLAVMPLDDPQEMNTAIWRGMVRVERDREKVH
jgi:hypothetical protein